MLSAGTIRWIKRLHYEGHSQRAIAETTGVARNTIAEILHLDRVAEELRDTLYDVEDPVFTEPPRRCETCGATVYMPCLACSLRESQMNAESE